MRTTFLLGLMFVCLVFQGQKAVFRPATIDLGSFSEAGSIRFTCILENTGTRPLVIFRADAPRGTDVFISKKSIVENDTALLTFLYHPKTTGVFNQKVEFTTNASEAPELFTFSGNVLRLLSDNLLNCVDFKPKMVNGAAEIPMLAKHRAFLSDAITGLPIQSAEITYVSKDGQVQSIQKDALNGFLEHPIQVGFYALIVKADGYEPLIIEQYFSSRSTSQNYMLSPLKRSKPDIEIATTESTNVIDTLDAKQFKPNNLVFLIDASGSMKEDAKLPLLKKALIRLINPLRSTDRISVIVYAESVKILLEAQPGNRKNEIFDAIEQLKAEGITAGSAGLEQAYQLIDRFYIDGGNNQILLANDGAFRLSAANRKKVEAQVVASEKPVLLSVVAMGSDEAALNMLNKLSTQGKGSFLHLKNGSSTEIDVLLEEITKRSRR